MTQKSQVCQTMLPLLLAFATTMKVVSLATADDNPGTTEHIRDIFLGRCFDYKEIRYKTKMPEVSEDCESLYEKFLAGFSSMPPCAVNISGYQPFIQVARQIIPQDKAMFWSGVKELAHEYVSETERYVTLEDTLIGYVVDSMVWCGQSSPPGINYTRCPSWTDCPSEASEAFWASASKAFAQSARGSVAIMLDASRAGQPAYRRDSFFGKHELPNLDRSLVNEVYVLLTHRLHTPLYENCENGSLVLLEQDVTSRGFSFSCNDDPKDILHLLCVKNPSDRACRLASQYVFRGLTPNNQDLDNRRTPFNLKPKDRFASNAIVG